MCAMYHMDFLHLSTWKSWNYIPRATCHLMPRLSYHIITMQSYLSNWLPSYPHQPIKFEDVFLCHFIKYERGPKVLDFIIYWSHRVCHCAFYLAPKYSSLSSSTFVWHNTFQLMRDLLFAPSIFHPTPPHILYFLCSLIKSSQVNQRHWLSEALLHNIFSLSL